MSMLQRRPALKIFIVFITFFLIVVFLSMVFGYQTLGGYIAPCLLLLITWWLYKNEGSSLSALGLTLTKRNLGFLPIGLLVGIVLYAVGMYAAILYQGLEISFNKNADYTIIAGGLFFFIQGVMNEELIFRGYCFKKTVEVYGVAKANIVFAILFLIWHWISWDAWGNYGLMLSAITVCFGHLLFATSLLRSGTLFLAIGIHLGNNWAVKHFAAYEGDIPIVNSIFVVTGSAQQESQVVLTGISTIWMLIVTALIMKFVRPKQ